MSADSLATVYQEASLLLSGFLEPALLSTRLEMIYALRPLPADYARVFAAEAVEQAQAGYAELWQTPPLWPIKRDQTMLRVDVAQAEDFLEDGPRAAAFPGGYRSIAHHLLPGRLWVCWEYFAPEVGSGLSFDGLVRLDDRWAWFPKPWRVLPATDHSPAASHWTE
jgi:hypothetical protein